MTLQKSLAACLFFTALAGHAVSAYAQQSSTPGASPPSSCSPAVTGSPCAANAANAAAGNPINLITGNKFQTEVDMPALPGVMGLEIIRHYNSAASAPGMPNGIVGRGWKLSYETDLYAVGKTIQIVQADGSRIIFSRDPLDPSQCSTADPANGAVQISKTSRGDEYTWRQTNGQQYSFNTLGKLVQIAARSGEFVTMQHDQSGLLLKVTDPQGRQLRLSYIARTAAQPADRFHGVQAIDSPVGRFVYGYGSALPPGATLDKVHVLANLVKVTYPTRYDSDKKAHPFTERGTTTSGISRLYHYEDARHPTLLTGIGVTGSGSGSDGKLLQQRIATFGYNVDGRAVLSTHAGDVDKVTLDYSIGGVTNSPIMWGAFRHSRTHVL